MNVSYTVAQHKKNNDTVYVNLMFASKEAIRKSIVIKTVFPSFNFKFSLVV